MGETMKTLKKRKSQGKTDYRARLFLAVILGFPDLRSKSLAL
jgi:hypothetical protein